MAQGLGSEQRVRATTGTSVGGCRISQVTVDVRDVAVMAAFWSAALGYSADRGEDGSAKLYPPDSAGPEAVTIWLQAVTEAKQAKNRIHLDVNPDSGRTVEGEVERLLSLGATHADVGQSASDRFVVLADPEGNEFCILKRSPRP